MPETIEAEVIEIDGKPPPTEAEGPSASDAGAASYGERFKGQILRLDRRWWPLWLLLGMIAVGLLLTIGVALGAVYLLYSLVRRFLDALFGSGENPSGGGGIQRF